MCLFYCFCGISSSSFFSFFFFNDTATTEIYTLSLHDALPILCSRLTCAATSGSRAHSVTCSPLRARRSASVVPQDRKSTRLNSSHVEISYAVFCLKKKKKKNKRNKQHNIYQDLYHSHPI